VSEAFDGLEAVRTMRLSRSFVIRLVIAIMWAAAAPVAVVLPLPPWTWPVLLPLCYPTLFIMGKWFPIGDLVGSKALKSVLASMLPSAMTALPIYLAVLYSPAILIVAVRRLRYLTAAALRRQVLFCSYFALGAVAGVLVGFTWALSVGLVGSRLAMAMVVLASSIAMGWLVAILRCTVRSGAR
jgi:hypothetical protein